MANIFLSVPILGKPELRMVYSTYQAILTAQKNKVRIFFNENDSLISRVRNVHISKFLHEFPECDYFMSIDSDIEVVNAFPTNNIFDKLVAHDVDFIGGLYALKKQGTKKCASIPMSGILPEFNGTIEEMRWMSTGCWCLKRSVVERMVEAYPELTYDGDDNAAGRPVHGLYIPMIYDMQPGDLPGLTKPFKKYLSEDWAFCHRWRKIGGKLFADPSIVLKHIGKADYSLWDVGIVRKERPNTPPPGFDLKENE